MTAALKGFFRRRPAATAADIDTEEEVAIRPIEWPLVKKLLGRLKPYRREYVVGIVVNWFQVAIELLSPAFVGTIVSFVGRYVGQDNGAKEMWINRALGYAAGGGDPALMTQSQAIHHLLALIGLWGLSVVIAAVIQRWIILNMVRAGEKVQFDYRNAMFSKLQQLDMGFYDRTKLGRIISRCTSDNQRHARGERLGRHAHHHPDVDHPVRHRHAGDDRLAAVPVGRVARAGAVLREPLLPEKDGPGVAGAARGLHPRQHEHGREHHRHARGDGVQPPEPEPGRIQPASGH